MRLAASILIIIVIPALIGRGKVRINTPIPAVVQPGPFASREDAFIEGHFIQPAIQRRRPIRIRTDGQRIGRILRSPCKTLRFHRTIVDLEIDRVMREQAPAGWKGDHAREAQVLNALFPLLDRNRESTRALFELVKNQPGYG